MAEIILESLVEPELIDSLCRLATKCYQWMIGSVAVGFILTVGSMLVYVYCDRKDARQEYTYKASSNGAGPQISQSVLHREYLIED